MKSGFDADRIDINNLERGFLEHLEDSAVLITMFVKTFAHFRYPE